MKFSGKCLSLTAYVMAILVMSLLASCGSDKKNEPDPIDILPQDVTRCIIVYAVNYSSLSVDFKDDSSEMLQGLEISHYPTGKLLVYNTYKVNSDTDELACALYEAVADRNGKYSFLKIKDYPRDTCSTDPTRIKDVIDYALSLYPNASYDMIFWGHGMSWKPYFSDHHVSVVNAYGGEYNKSDSYSTDWTEIDDLANCVPDNTFDTIWFDCCYMSGIEVLYEFRNKCKTFVGYPTEVYQYGMAYDRVIPYLMSDKHDVLSGARAFYEFYHLTDSPVTVAMCDMSKIEAVADIARTIYASGPERPGPAALINYSRSSSSPFYDFEQLLRLTATYNGKEFLLPALSEAMSDFVVYHAESEYNFNHRLWDTNNISGVSTHLYTGSDSRDESYYRTLSWYKRVY